ncbi:MAG TPA: hypothetical protein VLJ59_12545 [Mycobacteriales bacterium]|nr:hypothetical protein [Mycobacteriales bacterium]
MEDSQYPVDSAGDPAPGQERGTGTSAAGTEPGTNASAPGHDGPGPPAAQGDVGADDPSGGPASGSAATAQHGGTPADEGATGLNDENGGPPADERWAYEEWRRNFRVAGFAGVDLNQTRVRSIRSGSGLMAVGSGAQVIGAVHNHGARPDVALVGGLDPDGVRTAIDLHAANTPAENGRPERLDTHKAIYLAGDVRTGRFQEALCLLAERCGPDKIMEVYLDPGAGLAAFLNQRDVLQPGHGHVLELDSAEPVRQWTLRAAGTMARKAGAYLVILGPLPPEGVDELAEFTFVHVRPDAVAVLRKHLTHLLCCEGRRHPDGAPQGCGLPAATITAYIAECVADKDIAGYLRAGPAPQDVVELARRLAELRRQSRPPADALELLTTNLRRLAVEVLAPDEPPPTTDEERSAQARARTRKVAFRIAYAVFYDHPLTSVFDADRILHALVDSDPGDRAPRVDTVFDGGVNVLLDPKMRENVAAGTGPPQDEEEQRPRLVDPGLAGAILDVAWNKHDRIRRPLVQWLAILAGDHRERVRLRAAQAAGQLAAYDYGYVYRELLQPWARSPVQRHRQTASWALEFLAAQDPGQVGRVRGQLRDWAAAHSAYMNDAAARAYATSLGSDFFDDMLVSLRCVASKPELNRIASVAQAIAENYQPEVGTILVNALDEWAGDGNPSLRVHAARTTIFLAHRRAPSPNDAWPALLCLARCDDVRRQLLRLWRAALAEAVTAMRAWDMQRLWLVRADGRDELEEAAVRFAFDLWAVPPLRVRALHHLERIWIDDADLSVMRRLLTMLKGNNDDHAK